MLNGTVHLFHFFFIGRFNWDFNEMNGVEIKVARREIKNL
jgi:hypothetical protein